MTKAIVLSLVLLASLAVHASAQTKILGLLTESESTPLGIDVIQPRFTWQMSTPKRGASQTAYRIEVKDPLRQVVWDSGKITSSESLNIAYEGVALKAATRY